MTLYEYKTVDQRPVKTISPWRRLLEVAVHYFAVGRTFPFVIKDEKPAVCVLALTPDHRVILVEQYRPGPQKRLIELPGGALKKKEAVLDAAARELFEETGCVGTLELVGRLYVCAYSTGVRYVVVARNCSQIEIPVGKGVEKGDICVVFASLEQLLEYARSGEMTTGHAVYRALDHIGLLHPVPLP